MDWKDYIYSNPKIGFGKPIFKGTRIKVEFVLQLMAAGWTAETIIAEYEGLQDIHLRAAAGFAADLMRDESYAAVGQANAA